SSSSSFIFKESLETTRNPPKLHSKSIIPPYTHAKRAQEHDHHPNSTLNQEEQEKKILGIVAGLSACYSEF
ncbi:hypothetical protein, partial [Corynebacterium parakroppenstedtii]|uniref:hypothetical protein n=1 Tax=Corynebacterium parakroppenstedtii TaxID=2828363 RepID=UPI001F3A6F8F